MAEEDLIFGKNRNLFGGIAPSDMKVFTVTPVGSNITIQAELPTDTVIDGQTICSVAGAIIRKKQANYPEDEFDGELVTDLQQSGPFSFNDKDATTNDTYYYMAFPYSTQGVYNRDPVNRAMHTPIPSLPMVTFTATVDKENKCVSLNCVLPEYAVGAIIRRGNDSYPATETEGDAVTTITSSTIITDANIALGADYYYAAFPYTAVGTYNRDIENRAYALYRPYGYLYGYRINTEDSNPATRVVYDEQVYNTNFTPAKMNFTSGVFEYGSWTKTPGVTFMPSPCMLNPNGTVYCHLDPNDYTKKIDGSDSHITNYVISANAMMEWPKIYTKRWIDDAGYHFRCSDTKIDDGYECWCNYDKDNNEIPYFYTSIYTSSGSDGTARSLSGGVSHTQKKMSEEFNLARKNGIDWNMGVLADRLLITDLLVMMCKSTDSQSLYGKGRTGPRTNTVLKPGTMNTKGMFWGSDDHTLGVKVFGMENYWGNIWHRTLGYILDQNADTISIKLTRGNKHGSTSDYNLAGDGYVVDPFLTPWVNTGTGYIRGMHLTEGGRVPFYTTDGTSSTRECDWYALSWSPGVYAGCFGGTAVSEETAGLFDTDLGLSVNNGDPWVGYSLSCKPTKK